MNNALNKSTSLIFSVILAGAAALSLAHAKVDPKVVIKDLKKGKGHAAKNGDTLSVLYIGKFKDGKLFDSNMDAKYKATKPEFPVTLGAPQVIPGWEKGLIGAQEGTIRQMTIPYQLAYGERGMPGAIPPKSDLIFIVKVVKLTPGK